MNESTLGAVLFAAVVIIFVPLFYMVATRRFGKARKVSGKE